MAGAASCAGAGAAASFTGADFLASTGWNSRTEPALRTVGMAPSRSSAVRNHRRKPRSAMISAVEGSVSTCSGEQTKSSL